MIKKIFIAFFFVIGFMTAVNGIHELVHYLISRHYKAEVEEICFLGQYFTEDEKWYSNAAGWVAVTYNNDTDIERETHWSNVWDFNFTG